MTFQPERLQLCVVMWREVVRLEQSVELFEVAAMECYDCLRLEHALVFVQVFAGWQ